MLRRVVFLVLFIYTWHLNVVATMQKADILIINSDTLFLDRSPLEDLPEVCKKIKGKGLSTDCWNGFTAEWILIDSVLYLQNIYSCSTGNNINQLLENILNRKFEDGRLIADWFSDGIYGGFGRKLTYLYQVIYEKERYFIFDKGVLKTIKNYDAKDTEYSLNEDAVVDFVYKHFNWNILAKQNWFPQTVSIFLEADKRGKIKRLEYSAEKISAVHKEVKRILCLIPNWGVFYSEGKKHSFNWSYSFGFSRARMESLKRKDRND
jgi:hypothetical protein